MSQRTSTELADVTLRVARQRYFTAYGFDERSYDVASVIINLGPVRVRLPNVAARRAALPYHDAHHVLTGYGAALSNVPIGSPGWHGEAELAAWEFGTGALEIKSWEVWLVNGFATLLGMVRYPRKVIRAYARGTVSSTLYATPFDDRLLDTPLQELRARMGLLLATPPLRLRCLISLVCLCAWLSLLIGASVLMILIPLALAQTAWGFLQSISGRFAC